MKQYMYLIFDIDDTLLDFYSAFISAQNQGINFAELKGILQR